MTDMPNSRNCLKIRYVTTRYVDSFFILSPRPPKPVPSIINISGCLESGGYYRSAVGQQGVPRHDQQSEQKGLRPYRRRESWRSFLVSLKERGLHGTRLFIGGRCLGLLEAIGEVFPEVNYQRCVVHFYRNVFSVVPRGKMKQVAAMLKAIHVQEDKAAAREKARAVASKLRKMKLKEAAKKVEDSIEETLTYMDFPASHWTKLRTTNVLELINHDIRRRTKVVGPSRTVILR